VTTPPDADGAAALLAAAGQRAAGVMVTADEVLDLQTVQLGSAQPEAQPDQGGGQP
jgi:hypothetical protein